MGYRLLDKMAAKDVTKITKRAQEVLDDIESL
jgi:hypothetical protein